MERTISTSDISVDSLLIDHSHRPQKKRAKVWEHIESEIVDGKEKATYKYCKLKLSSEPGQGTNYLNRHIGVYCPNIPSGERDRFLLHWKRPSSDGDQPIFDAQVCRLLVAKLFVSAEIAFRKADDPNWKNLMNYIHPSFLAVGHQTVKSDCIALYEETKKHLHHNIEKLGSHVSLTADLWTSNQNLGYICVTAHYINAEFELQKFIISFKKIYYPHTSYVVQDGLTFCLVEWDLINKLFTLTLDNASVNDRATKDLRNTLGAKMFLKAEHFHVRCNAHILNIMVQNGAKLITSAIAKVRDIVKTITSTPSRMQIFNSIVQRMGLKTKFGLVVDVPHRWNATYDMIHESLEYKAALNIYATEQHHEAPSDSDWGKAESLHDFLQAFNDATKVFSADRHPTSHLFLKLVLAIRLLDERWEQDQLLQQMANAIYVKFRKYWNEPNIILLIAAVMDPTQKLDYLRFYFYTIGGNVQEKIKELRICLNKYYLEYEKIVRSHELPTFIERDEHTLTREPSSSSAGGSLLGKRRIELAFAQFTSQNVEMHTEKSELDNYLEDPRVHSNSEENFEVLGWWKTNADVYPILSLMAKDFLAIPVSTVSSESAFSAAGRLFGKGRTSLSPKTLEALICTKDWIIGFDDDEKGYATEGSRICDLEQDL